LYNSTSTAGINATSDLDYNLAARSIVCYYGLKAQELNGYGFGKAEQEHHKYGILKINKSIQSSAMLTAAITHVRSGLQLNSGNLYLNDNLLFIESRDPNSISSIGGNILTFRSSWINNSGVKWKVRSPEKYLIPFSNSVGQKTPIVINTLQGTGHIRLLSYSSPNRDNTPYPNEGPNGAVSHIDKGNGQDFSIDAAVDRWYQIEASGIKADVELTFLPDEESTTVGQSNSTLKISAWKNNHWSAPFGRFIDQDSQIGKVKAQNVTEFGTWLIIRTPRSNIPNISLNATIVGSTVELSWTTKDPKDYNTYTVQRSKNGTQYENIGISTQVERGDQTSTFSYTDEDPIEGTSFYSVTRMDANGQSLSSSTEKVDFIAKRIKINNVYPNPFRNSFTLEFNAFNAEEMTITIYNMSGQIVDSEYFSAQLGTNKYSFNGGSELEPGHYLVSIKTENGEFSKRVLKAF
ncbi:MAG: T9SS type A sorting domain-containing protein, partial [Bacteroidia bacterium]|nr:T9SS type A sorting domain-containing protein [Bacteroidia bacterium]